MGKYINKTNKSIFITVFILGFLIHGFRLTNHLLTWDSVFNFHDPQIKISLGRCFLSLGAGLSSFYDIQWVIGLISLLWLGLTCVLLCEIFEIKKDWSGLLMCGVVVSFPSVAGTFAYMYTADGYMLAGLLATLCVYLTKKGIERVNALNALNAGDPGRLPGQDILVTDIKVTDIKVTGSTKLFFIFAIVSMGLSAGMYQAYTSYGLMIIVVYCLELLLFGNNTTKQVLRTFIIMMATAFLGVLAYLVCNKLIVILSGTVASGYNGISTMSFPGPGNIILGIKNSLIDTAYFFIGPLDKISLFQVLNVIMLVGTAVFIVFILLKNSASALRKGAVALCLLAMPFICFMIYFISPQVRYYMLMMGPLELIYIIPVLIFDNWGQTPKPQWEKALIPGIALIMSLIIFNFGIISNISYLYMVTDNEKTLQFVGRMAQRIEELPEFKKAERLCIIGNLPDHDKIEVVLPPAMAGIKDGILISDTAHFTSALNTYCGIKLKPVDKEDPLSDKLSKGAEGMGTWPDLDCITQKDDIIIVRFS